MIRRNMLARVVAVAVAMGASLPLAVAQERYAPGYEDDSDDVRRVGRRGREDVEEGRSEEAHARNEEREAQREAERMQREQEQQQRQMERESAQQQREQERAQAEQYRAAEQQQRGMEQEQRQAEQQQREAMRAMEQERRQGEQQQREMQRAAEQAQRQAEQEQRAYEREQRQAEQARQPRELELQRGEGERGGGRRTHWTEEQRAEQLRVDREYAEQQQRQQAAPARGAESDAREEIRRVEQERYQVERGGDRQRYDESRDGRDGRGSRDRGVTEERSYGRDRRHDGGWGDPRQRWNANPREIPQPREGARLSDRERQSLYNQQRQHADRYGRDWSRRVDDYQRRVDSLQGRRNEQYRYQQRYWQRHRDYRSRWLSFGWNYQRDPFFYSAPTHRYYRGGRWYSANRYAIDVLQQAIRIGYEEGYYAGEADRYDGWRAGWRDNYAYQDASLGYQGWYVSEEEYRYYFREGFRRGYEDAFNRRWRYGRRYQSGFSILPNELDVILRFELGR